MDIQKQREILSILQKLKQEKEQLAMQNSSLKQENEKLIYQNKLLINKIKSIQSNQSDLESFNIDSMKNDSVSKYDEGNVIDLDSESIISNNVEQNSQLKEKNKKNKMIDVFDIVLIVVIIILLLIQIYIIVK